MNNNNNNNNINISHPTISTLDQVSPHLARLILNVFLVGLSGVISLFGIGANIVNIVVFVREGFKDSINISLLGLAVADLMCVISTFWMSLSCSPFFAELGLPFHGYDVTYISGTWSRVCSNRITSCINVFIALERCLCVTLPIKVKIIITPLKTKIIIISIFIFMFIIFSPFFYVNKLEWVFSQYFNRTLLTLVFADNRDIVDAVSYILHSVSMSSICLIAIIVCTLILIVSLNKKVKWREQSTGQSLSKQTESSPKEKKVVKMVTLISIIFIVCYLPATIIFLYMCLNPEFGVSGRYINTYYVVWVVTIFLETVNSSVNIFVYLTMSSKFKRTLLLSFWCE